jgi:two-component system sensor histidine kinase PilS (NtrC family)
MESQRTKREWLQWLARVRLLMIVLILAVGVFWPQYATGQPIGRLFLSIIIFWITLGSLELILVRWIPDAPWLGGLQIGCDIVVITGVVYATGIQDSYFISLYLLVIIIASILFSRQGSFLVAVACLVALSTLEIFAYAGKIPFVGVTLGSVAGDRSMVRQSWAGFSGRGLPCQSAFPSP